MQGWAGSRVGLIKLMQSRCGAEQTGDIGGKPQGKQKSKNTTLFFLSNEPI